MGYILKNQVPVLMKGYPTVSDKYNVRGATLASTSPIGHFGDIVKFGDNGYFTVADATNTITAATQVAGILLATNVKLLTEYGAGPEAEVTTKPGEAFNLMLDGFVAIELKADTDMTTIKEGLQVGLTAEGKAELATEAGAVKMPWYFTGTTYEDDYGRLLAGIHVPSFN